MNDVSFNPFDIVNSDSPLVGGIPYSNSDVMGNLSRAFNPLAEQSKLDLLSSMDDFIKGTNLVDPFATQKPTFKRARFSNDTFHICLDSEYTVSPDPKRNVILSYQYVASTRSKSHDPIQGLIMTRINAKGEETRLTLKQFISKVIRHALRKKHIEKVPELVCVSAHFLRADLSAFLNFFNETTIVNGIRKTLATLKNTYGIDQNEILGKYHHHEKVKIYDNNNNPKQVEVRFIDTQLLTPNQRGLEHLGEIVNLPKLSIPEPYSIENMKDYLEQDRKGFEAYAMRDAEIVHRYVMQILDFTENEFGQAFLPVTLASLAVSLFQKELKTQKIDNHSFFGKHKEKIPRYQPDRKAYRTFTQVKDGGGALTLKAFASESYHGGRNEAFTCGYTPEGEYYDYDLPSAYTIAMLNLHPLDYDGYRQTKNPDDFKGNVLGMARVNFSYPESIRYPSLPVTSEHGLIFPRQGESYCSAPEIEAALNQGCHLEILEGFVIPWSDTEKFPFLSFVKFIRNKRKQHEKGSLFELLWKEIGNSLYGKLAQGLKGKTTFDVQDGFNKLVPESPITCAYYACYITGFVRAVIGELLNGIPEDKFAISVTTDGFLTNACLDEINLQQTLTKRYKTLLDIVAPDDNNPVLELKHQVQQLCCMRTRGQFTVKAGKGSSQGEQIVLSDKDIVLAKSSVQVPDDIRKQGKTPFERKQLENMYIATLYANREYDQKIPYSTLTSTRDSFIKKADLVKNMSMRKVNLEFDMKRRLVDCKAMTINGINGVFIQTQPWDHVSQFYEARACFSQWIHRCQKCLQTSEDFAEWEEYYHAKMTAKTKLVNVSAKQPSVRVLLRQFLRCFVRQTYGVNVEMTYDVIAKQLTEQGYRTTVNDLKNAKRKNAPIVLGCVADTSKTQALLKVLLSIAPDFEYQAFFS